jgi:hypothetical protein
MKHFDPFGIACLASLVIGEVEVSASFICAVLQFNLKPQAIVGEFNSLRQRGVGFFVF